MENLEKIIAIELFNAAQAMEFRRPAKTSPYLENFIAAYRKYVKFIEDDEIMYTNIAKSINFLRDYKLELPGEDVTKYQL